MSSKKTKEGGLGGYGPRIDKLENFLHEAFNWSDPSVKVDIQRLMASRKTSTSPMNKAATKFGKKPTAKKMPSKEPARPKYIVDTSEKPQDPGRPNEMANKRNEEEKKRLLKAKNNPVTVQAHAKFHNLGETNYITEKKISFKQEAPHLERQNKASSISEQQPPRMDCKEERTIKENSLISGEMIDT